MILRQKYSAHCKCCVSIRENAFSGVSFSTVSFKNVPGEALRMIKRPQARA